MHLGVLQCRYHYVSRRFGVDFQFSVAYEWTPPTEGNRQEPPDGGFATICAVHLVQIGPTRRKLLLTEVVDALEAGLWSEIKADSEHEVYDEITALCLERGGLED